MSPTTLNETFDIIIVGAGTAGSLLAARLSTDPSLQILVLEAGQNRNDDANVRTPNFQRNLLGNSTYDWKFQTSPESGLNGRVIRQPRGKLWGGSSAINSHALVYPSRGYHDAWNSLLGREGKETEVSWDWEGVSKYYRSFQTVQKPSENVRLQLGIGNVGREVVDTNGSEHEEQESKEKGTSIQASYPVTPHVLQKAWVDTIRDLGFSTLKDPIEGDGIGGSTTTNSIDSNKGERSHAGIEFLEPSTKRDNVHVISNVIVERIEFDDNERDGKLVATGVLYRQEDHDIKTVHARREVVLCAGTFGSPKVLELSGLGQRDRLVSAGIKCRRNLPGVGENLQDHLNFGPSVEVQYDIETTHALASGHSIAKAPEGSIEPKREGAAYSFTHLPLNMPNLQDEERDLTILIDKIFKEGSSTTPRGLKAQYEIIKRIVLDPKEATTTLFMIRGQRYTPPSQPAQGDYMTVIAMLSYPFSRGTSHILSTDSSEPPEIKFNYLQHPLDTEILSRHVIQVGQMLKLPSLSAHIKPDGNTLPYGYPREAKNAKDIEGYLRDFSATNYHPTGTCAMMSEDLGGVVDEYLKVYGTANVRVCDASVIPILPRGNILSTVYAVAEKGAHILKSSLALTK